jgi:hypothetical protein
MIKSTASILQDYSMMGILNRSQKQKMGREVISSRNLCVGEGILVSEVYGIEGSAIYSPNKKNVKYARISIFRACIHINIGVHLYIGAVKKLRIHFTYSSHEVYSTFVFP